MPMNREEAAAALSELHAEFQRLDAALSAADDDGQAHALVELHAHLLRHFAFEEELMEGLPHSQTAAHRREHGMLLAVVSKVRLMRSQGDTAVAHRLADELALWLARHEASMDAALLATLPTAEQAETA